MMDKDARSLEREWQKLPTPRDLARMLREVLVVWESVRYSLTSEHAVTHLRRKRNTIELAAEVLDRVEHGGTLSTGQIDLVMKLVRRAKEKQRRDKRERSADQQDPETRESIEPGGPGLRSTEDRKIDVVQPRTEGAVSGN